MTEHSKGDGDLPERAARLLGEMAGAARSEADWQAQEHAILARIGAVERLPSDAALLVAPLPREPAEPDEHLPVSAHEAVSVRPASTRCASAPTVVSVGP